MEVKDLSWNDVNTKRYNSRLLPRSIRGLIIGKSGCGKTILLLNLLLRPGWLDYNSFQVFGKWRKLLDHVSIVAYICSQRAGYREITRCSRGVTESFHQRASYIKIGQSPTNV